MSPANAPAIQTAASIATSESTGLAGIAAFPLVAPADCTRAAGGSLESRSDDVTDDVSHEAGTVIDQDGSSSSTAGTHTQHSIVVARTQ